MVCVCDDESFNEEKVISTHTLYMCMCVDTDAWCLETMYRCLVPRDNVQMPGT